MLKYFENGELQAESIDLAQDCGEITVNLMVEKECDNCDLYLEFDCPKNTKFVSEKLSKIGTKEYQVLMPRTLSANVGEVYTQLVKVSPTQNKLLARSLKSRNPIFVISESILASNKW